MLPELMAANAAFAAIKAAVQNGKEIVDVASKVGEYVNATEDLRRKGERKKRSPFHSGGDLEEFIHLERLKQQEEQLKQIMIWSGRPGLWSDWQRFQAEARKERLRQAEARRRRRKQTIEIVIAVIAMVALGAAGFLLFGWILFLKSL